ncbi:MAG: LapA family protein [Nocardioidaceae bacterium]|nr:LapA family protein [Nocardioidaceae bacterium]
MTDTFQDGDSAGADDPLRRSRTSSVWIAIALFAVLLLLLIIFIAQNTQSVAISFLGWSGHAPLAVSLLAASLVGIVLTLVAGSLRIVQLRRRIRRERRAATVDQPPAP